MLDHCLQTKKKFVEFLRDKYAREPSLDLSSLLIQPIQRIPRYELLFSDIIRSSETEYLLDAPALHQCLSLVQEIARLVNDRKRETDELRKLSNLQKEFPCIRVRSLENLRERVEEKESDPNLIISFSLLFSFFVIVYSGMPCFRLFDCFGCGCGCGLGDSNMSK